MTKIHLLTLSAASAALGLSSFSLLSRRGEDVESLDRRIDTLQQSVRALEEPRANLGLPRAMPADDRLEDLARRVERVEFDLSQRTLAEPAAERSEPVQAPVANENDRRVLGPEELAAFERLLPEMLRFADDPGRAGSEEAERFWRTLRTTDAADALVAKLEAKVQHDGADLAARMDLADAYVAKLLSVPPGPEQGVWGARAEEQWNAVVERDPDHWGAQSALGQNFAMYPDFLGRTADSIRHLERARAIQEHGVIDPSQARTYSTLARMYQRQGRPQDAAEILRAGLARHPDDADLARALKDLPH